MKRNPKEDTISVTDASFFETGDSITLTYTLSKPRWYQLRKLFSWYVLRRRIGKEEYVVEVVKANEIRVVTPGVRFYEADE